LALPIERLMIETRIVDAALIPWPPVPTLIGLPLTLPPLIWPALVPPLVVVSAIALRPVAAVITLAVLPARLSGVS
jgi:hypothetical protein